MFVCKIFGVSGIIRFSMELTSSYTSLCGSGWWWPRTTTTRPSTSQWRAALEWTENNTKGKQRVKGSHTSTRTGVQNIIIACCRGTAQNNSYTGAAASVCTRARWNLCDTRLLIRFITRYTHPVLRQRPMIDDGLGQRVNGESSNRDQRRRRSVDGVDQIAFKHARDGRCFKSLR